MPKAAEYFFEDLTVGMSAKRERRVNPEDVQDFSRFSGDYNPIHSDDRMAQERGFPKAVAHGFLTASFVSGVVGMQLPGSTCILRESRLTFTHPVFIGDTVCITVSVSRLIPAEKSIKGRRYGIVILHAEGHVGDSRVFRGSVALFVAHRE